SWGGPAFARGASPGLRKKLSAACLEESLRRAAAAGASAASIALPPLATLSARVNPLLALGGADRSLQVTLIDLSLEEEALWQGMEKRARNACAFGEKQGLEIVEARYEDYPAFLSL